MLHARHAYLLSGFLVSLTAATPGSAQNRSISVDASTVMSLETKLRAFAAGLPMSEKRAFAGMLSGAAGAPSDNPAAISVQANYIASTAPGRSMSIQKSGMKVSPNSALAIGPKQDDPRNPPPTPERSIGPKQDDPRAPGIVRDKLRTFASGLSLGEGAALDWLMQRAGSRPSIGGIPPEEGPSLAQALGINPLAIGPKQDDPSPPPQAFKASLRY